MLTTVREKDFKLTHEVYEGAPNDWAKDRGATHTLYCGEGIGKGTRPAKLLKTRLYVGIDEGPNETIIWEKWEIRQIDNFPEVELEKVRKMNKEYFNEY